MTKTANAASKPSELATAKETAITVQVTYPAPIAADASAKWEAFTARPGVAATGNALSKVKDGFILVYAHEKEFTTGQNLFRFLFDASKAILGPLLVLLWLAINTAYVWIRKPETKAAAAAKWKSAKAWAAPKFDYERDVELELND